MGAPDAGLGIVTFIGFMLVAVTILLLTGSFEVIYVEGRGYVHAADDHMITMRVAQNFAQTGFPYFNQSEAVAANTSLFWPMMLSGVFVLANGAKATVLVVIMSVVLSAVSATIAAMMMKDFVQRAAVLVFLVLGQTFQAYGATGWEHVPQTFFVTLGFYLIYRASREKLNIPNIAMIYLSFSFLFRPDSAILIAVVGLVWYFHNLNYRKLSTYGVAFALLLLPVAYLYSMDFFYDDWVPNTAHLKRLGFLQSLESGFLFIFNYVAAGMLPTLFIILLVLRPKSRFVHLLLATVAAHIVYVISVGGDVFNHGRFFMVLLPVMTAVAMRELISKLDFGGQRTTETIIAGGFTIVLLLSIGPNFVRGVFANPDLNTPISEQVRIAHVINQKISPKSGSVGMHYLGVSYHLPNFHIVDFLGKAEPYIAQTEIKAGPIGHNRWDYDYAFEKYDIAVVPIRDATVMLVQSNGFVLQNQSSMFWYKCALRAIKSGNYQYIPSEYFQNQNFGAFVRNDLVHLFDKVKD